MKENIALETLRALRQLDIDAVHAYGQAIERIEVAAIRTRLEEFQADHEQHIPDLESCIRRLGGEPEPPAPDVKGFLIEGFTALRSMTGTEGALKAMLGNEETTNKRYRQALGVDFRPDILSVVERNYDDEERHLAYVQSVLADRSWERAA